MPLYTAHVYREMKLKFLEVEADSPEAASRIACELPHRLADAVDECDGETSTTPVDVYGDEAFEQSRWIDLEGERLRRAAPKLLAAAKRTVRQFELVLEMGDPQACTQTDWEAEPLASLRAAIAEAEGGEPSGATAGPSEAGADVYTYRLSGRDFTCDLIEIVSPAGRTIASLPYWPDPETDERERAEAAAKVICDQLNRWCVGGPGAQPAGN